MMMVACCVGWCKQLTGSEGGVDTLPCTIGCGNMRVAVLGNELQLVISCFSKWGPVGKRTGDGGGEQETTVVVEG